MSNDVWDGVSPQIILEIAIHSLDNYELLELEKMISTYRRKKIERSTQQESNKLIA